MLRIILLLLLQITVFFHAKSQIAKPFMIYNEKGKSVKLKKMMQELSGSQIVLFGELHNNPISHWLQIETTKFLQNERKVVLGAEMFEADQQLVLNAYLSGEINAAQMDSLITLWPNYATDYQPLVNFAKENKGSKIKFLKA